MLSEPNGGKAEEKKETELFLYVPFFPLNRRIINIDSNEYNVL